MRMMTSPAGTFWLRRPGSEQSELPHLYFLLFLLDLSKFRVWVNENPLIRMQLQQLLAGTVWGDFSVTHCSHEQGTVQSSSDLATWRRRTEACPSFPARVWRVATSSGVAPSPRLHTHTHTIISIALIWQKHQLKFLLLFLVSLLY